MIPIFSRYTFTQLSKTLLTLKPPIGIISMNSAEDKNCLSIEMNHQLSQSIDTLSKDPSINLIIFDSKVPKLFSGGGPLKYFYHATSQTFKNNDIFRDLQNSLNNLKKPIVTAINGTALGGAFEIALSTDMILCSKSSRFAMTQLKLGLSTVLGGAQRLSRIIGKGNTGKIFYGAGMIKPQRMMELGLVTEIFEDQGFDETILEYCGKIAEMDQDSLITIKSMARITEQ